MSALRGRCALGDRRCSGGLTDYVTRRIARRENEHDIAGMPGSHPEPVVLLHGLGRTSRSMRRIERRLLARGYRVLNIDYPSRTGDIARLARHVAADVATWESGRTLHFVTHSLGGIILREAVVCGRLPAERIGRVVMLGPPNGGSELVDELNRLPVLERLLGRAVGPAGKQLGVGRESYVTKLPPVTFSVGVIAGNRSFNPFFSAILGDANDGKVRIERTRVEGMTDFLVVRQWHAMLPVAGEVISQTIRFLEFGSFDHV